ncbi:single-stranded DNA-binding protein [Pseudarthrobacter oxydans]|uniref:Single-stranded DNA-binding protein n=1 Tax=Pseudarthrobacter oxydans TaxID=1671 RepID=A0AAW8NFC3_PSEOX|nr:single-stranded DNA-binding protein [Pseudarthrobacter oxydans]MBU3995053.1 single-stranded DNA-binding protein [Actinomycetota bacterium]MDR7165786.1 single-stranded DNA-binding protein [Pseudarthrobacter oxydans]
MSDLHTQQSLSGFIASDPKLSYTSKGDARFYAKIGQEHYRPEADGSFTKLETTFHDMVQYRKAAEEAFARFRKRDWFIAEGYVKTYPDKMGEQREEFVAKKLGHDTARTDYEVVRKEPTSAEKATTIAAALQAAQESTDQVVGHTDSGPAVAPTATTATMTGPRDPAPAAAVGL